MPETDGEGGGRRSSDRNSSSGSGSRRVLRAAASFADGHPVDLGDLGGGLDRRALILVLAAMAHAAGSHDHRSIAYDPDGIPRPGDPMRLLVARPLRD